MKKWLVMFSISLFCLAAALPPGAAVPLPDPVPPLLRIGSLSEIFLDVPYVPTPSRIVKKMLQIAKVTADDVLYDLGCGDGRLVITAAKEMGARGVGVDMNPTRIRESRENALRAQVKDRVTFLEQDLFKTDIRDATVLSLYLLPEVNLRLRPKILREMKPGSRVVSHDYGMGEWEPDEYEYAGVDSIYFWIVPANLSGTWECTFPSGQGVDSFTLIIDQKFQRIDGIASKGSARVALKDAKLTGDRVEFTVEQKRGGKKVSMKFEGHVQGDVIEGTVTRQGRDQGPSYLDGAARPLDSAGDRQRRGEKRGRRRGDLKEERF